jgi:transcriptional regulator with XRE-family HTH domain
MVIFKSMKINLADKIKFLRKENGWTQADLAKQLHCSQELIAAYENKRRKPTIDKIPDIAKIFRISINELYGSDFFAERQEPINHKLVKKLRSVENLPPKAQKKVVDFINLVVKANGTD